MSFVEFNKINAIEHLFTLLHQVQLRLTGGRKESVLEPSNFKYTARAKGEGREGGSIKCIEEPKSVRVEHLFSF